MIPKELQPPPGHAWPALKLHKPAFGPEWVTAVAFLIVVCFSQTGYFNIPHRINGPVEVEIVGGPAPYVPPDDGVNPGPVDPIDPRFSAVAAEAAALALTVDTRDLAGEAKAIAAAMDAIAARAAAGTLSLVDIFGAKGKPGLLAQEIGRKLGRSNDNWKEWGAALSRSLGRLHADKVLQTPADAAAALRAIAGQLRGIA